MGNYFHFRSEVTKDTFCTSISSHVELEGRVQLAYQSHQWTVKNEYYVEHMIRHLYINQSPQEKREGAP